MLTKVLSQVVPTLKPEGPQKLSVIRHLICSSLKVHRGCQARLITWSVSIQIIRAVWLFHEFIQLIHSVTGPIHLFIRPLIHLFTCPCTHSFIHSFFFWAILFNQASKQQTTKQHIHSFTYSFIHSFVHSFIRCASMHHSHSCKRITSNLTLPADSSMWHVTIPFQCSAAGTEPDGWKVNSLHFVTLYFCSVLFLSRYFRCTFFKHFILFYFIS